MICGRQGVRYKGLYEDIVGVYRAYIIALIAGVHKMLILVSAQLKILLTLLTVYNLTMGIVRVLKGSDDG